jgi:hypothetical protein
MKWLSMGSSGSSDVYSVKREFFQQFELLLEDPLWPKCMPVVHVEVTIITENSEVLLGLLKANMMLEALLDLQSIIHLESGDFFARLCTH